MFIGAAPRGDPRGCPAGPVFGQPGAAPSPAGGRGGVRAGHWGTPAVPRLPERGLEQPHPARVAMSVSPMAVSLPYGARPGQVVK